MSLLHHVAKRNARLCVAAGLLVNAFSLATGVWSANFPSIPFLPDKYSDYSAWIYSANDGFGRNLGTDEDNLRTYGVNTGALLSHRFLLECNYSSLTNRGVSQADAGRIDEVGTRAGYRLLDLASPGAAFSLFTGAGGLFYGNFYGSRIQEGAHGKDSLTTRPIPHAYDSPSDHALAFTYAEGYLPRACVNATLYGHLTSAGDYDAVISAGYWANKPMIQIKYQLSYETNSVTHVGSAAQAIYGAERGFWFSTKVMVGPIVLERSFDLNSLTEASYEGFRFNFAGMDTFPSTPYRISYSLGWSIGNTSWVEYFAVHPFDRLPAIGIDLRNYHTENFFVNNVTNARDDRRIRRTNETSLGLQWFVQNPDDYHLLRGFLFGGGGFSREMVTSDYVYQAHFYELVTTPIVHAGIGMRVDIPDLIFKNGRRFLGGELAMTYRYAFKQTNIFANPDVLLNWALVFSER